VYSQRPVVVSLTATFLEALALLLFTPACATGGDPLPECPDFVPWPDDADTCRSDADCSAGLACLSYDPSCPTLASGTYCRDDEACGEDVCANGLAPQLPYTTNCYPGVCVPRCTASSCEAGFVCAATGFCQVVSCNDGFECPPERTCALENSSWADTHSCVPRSCTEGVPCPGRFICDPAASDRPDDCRLPHCGEPDAAPCEPNRDCGFSADSASGCVQRSCQSNDDCDCGLCLFGTCASRPGICVAPNGSGSCCG
jgi:hypothetical protein